MQLRECVAFAFNKFFYDLVKGVKELAPELKKDIKTNYKAKSQTTEANLELLSKSLGNDDVYQKLVDVPVAELLADELVSGVEIMKGISVKDVVANTPKEYHPTLSSFLYIFALLVTVDKQEDEDAGMALFTAVMNALRSMQKGEPYEEALADVYDDDIKVLVANTSKVIVDGSSSVEDASPDFNPDMFENTKIGSLAKEITSEIKFDDLKIEKPEDIVNLASSGMIGDIMSKVGSKLNEKLDKGEIKHDELLKEAFSFMGAMQKGGNPLFNNPMVQNMMKNMGNAHINESKLKNMSARERLRKKHEDRYGKP